MSKKKSNQNIATGNNATKIEKATEKKIVNEQTGALHKYSNLLIAAGIALATFIFFKVCLANQFVSWDDPGYVTENPLIRNTSAAGLRQIFSTPVMGNYHPLTILSLAIEYSYVQLEPWLYHFDSLMLHIIVTMLVYWLILLITRKPIAAAFTALLFALHPMHVESVAWVSARKDVLYGTFYIASLIAYVHYLRREGAGKWLLYADTLLFFVLSLLSKPVAVALPLVLLLLDYLEQRKNNMALWVDKAPFFVLAIGFGIKSVMDQREIGVVSKLNEHFSIVDTVSFGCYTLGTYLWKALLPVGLSCFYPYPPKVNNLFPLYYYAFPFIVAGLIFVVWKFARKNRNIVFGCLFFLVNIALLLQFLPVGNAIVAERYTYIPYIGLFFIFGWWVSNHIEARQSIKPVAITAGLLLCLTMGYASSERCKVWYNGHTLWTDQMAKHPDNEYAYASLGVEYFDKWKNAHSAEEEQLGYDSAQYLLNKAIQLNPDYVNPYMSLGIMARVLKRYDEAKYDFKKVIALDNGRQAATGNLGLGILYFITRQLDSSAYHLREAIRLKPDLQPAHVNYANLLDLTDHPEDALKEYNLSVSLNPESHESYLNRGRLFLRAKRINEAFADINKAVALKPTSGESYYARALCYGEMGNKQAALQDLEMAATYGYREIEKDFYEKLIK